jgi:hypothetical protein
MRVSNEAKNVIPLKFLRKINFFFPLVNSIRGHTVAIYTHIKGDMNMIFP